MEGNSGLAIDSRDPRDPALIVAIIWEARMPLEDFQPTPIGVALAAIIAWFAKRYAATVDRDVARLDARIDHLEQRLSESECLVIRKVSHHAESKV